jgi:hypothetical protein
MLERGPTTKAPGEDITRALLRSGCSVDTSPPVGCLRRNARTRGEPLCSLQLRAITSRRRSFGDLRERLAANHGRHKELR